MSEPTLSRSHFQRRLDGTPYSTSSDKPRPQFPNPINQPPKAKSETHGYWSLEREVSWLRGLGGYSNCEIGRKMGRMDWRVHLLQQTRACYAKRTWGWRKNAKYLDTDKKILTRWIDNELKRIATEGTAFPKEN